MPSEKELLQNAPNNDNAQAIPIPLSLAEKALSCLHFFSQKGHPGFFTSRELFNVSLTSTALHGRAQPELTQNAAQKLVTHVVLGEEAEARAMIIANPRLLLIKATAVDYCGRTIEGENADGATAFQVAIGVGDD